MAFSGLSHIFSKRSLEKTPQHSLALEIGKDFIKAALWQEGEKTQTKAVVKTKTVQEAIAELKEKFASSEPLNKVIFGLSPDQVDNETIKPEVRQKLQKITKEFALKPAGFVVIPEAIVNQMALEEESPQTAILVGVEKESLVFSLFRAGQNKKVVSVGRSDKIYPDFEKGLAHFANEDLLPAKIILYDQGQNLDNLKEELISFPWKNNERFLHVPKIIALPWDYSIRAVVQASLSEIGQEDVGLSQNQEKEELPVDTENLGFVSEKTAKMETVVEAETAEPPKPATPEKSITKTLPKPKLPLTLPRLALPNIRISVAGVIVLIALILLSALAIGFYYFYPLAEIELVTNPEILSDNIEITLNTSIESVAVEDKEIPAVIHAVKVSGEDTLATTGKKKIGEAAKGEVTIYNKTTAEKTFTKGTVLTGPDKLKFVLDVDVKVASVSDVVTGTPGSTKAAVTATAIGPLGNIKGGADFTIADFAITTYAARSNADFSGGSEREISVASLQDHNKLLNKLQEELVTEAKSKIGLEIGSDQRLLEESLNTNVIEKVFDKDVDEETDNLNLKLNLEISATSYKQADLNNFLAAFLKENSREGFTLSPEKTALAVTEKELQKNGNLLLKGKYTAYLIPQIDTEKVRKELAGKYLDDLPENLRRFVADGIIGYEVTFLRKVPFFKNRLPALPRNIKTTVKIFAD